MEKVTVVLIVIYGLIIFYDHLINVRIKNIQGNKSEEENEMEIELHILFILYFAKSNGVSIKR